MSQNDIIETATAMFISEKHIDDLIRKEYDLHLPLGFAERVASLAMDEGRGRIWENIFRLSPRMGFAFSAFALVLFLLGISGQGPGIIESVINYPVLSEFIPLQ